MEPKLVERPCTICLGMGKVPRGFQKRRPRRALVRALNVWAYIFDRPIWLTTWRNSLAQSLNSPAKMKICPSCLDARMIPHVVVYRPEVIPLEKWKNTSEGRTYFADRKRRGVDVIEEISSMERASLLARGYIGPDSPIPYAERNSI